MARIQRADLTGKKFGHWTVLRRSHKHFWLCRCRCGTEKPIRADSLRQCRTKSCSDCHAFRHGQASTDRRIDLTGCTFGKWTVLRYARQKPTRWLCRCACGVEHEVRGAHLRNGHTHSCKACHPGNYRHGATAKRKQTRAYRIWAGMIDRCKRHKSYVGRGITVCKRWHLFENFLADMGDPPDGLTLERIRNNGGYKPSNCKWATSLEQARNQRRTWFVNINGVEYTLAELRAKAYKKFTS